MKKYIILILLLFIMLCGCATNEENKENEAIDKNEPEVNNPTTKQEKIAFLGSDNDLYRINITTNNNDLPQNEDEYIQGSLNITEQNTSIYLKDDLNVKIRLRGNSTKDPEKKPYKIKFDEKESLFGLTAAKEWVLLANYYDKTNIRNFLAYRTASKLNSFDFQPSYIFVDLYLNNEYHGLYMLSEQMEANEGRVDIQNKISSDGIKSFLIEADWRSISEYSGYENECYFLLRSYAFKFKYPNANNYLEALKNFNTEVAGEYITNISWAMDYMKDVANAIDSNDYNKFSKFIDINSFIDYYLIQEFFKNVDTGGTSQFYIIEHCENSSILKCGPVWDFDIAMGVVGQSQTSNEYALYKNSDLYAKEADYFYKQLFKNETFVQKVKERYSLVRPVLLEIFDEIQNIETILTKAQERNLAKWPLPTQRRDWIEIYAMGDEYYSLTSSSQHYRYLEEFLRERLITLDRYYK